MLIVLILLRHNQTIHCLQKNHDFNSSPLVSSLNVNFFGSCLNRFMSRAFFSGKRSTITSKCSSFRRFLNSVFEFTSIYSNHYSMSNGSCINTNTMINISSCFFESNQAEKYGGVIYINGLFGGDSLITSSVFIKNSAFCGGCVFISSIKASILIDDCKFIKSYAETGSHLHLNCLNTQITKTLFDLSRGSDSGVFISLKGTGIILESEFQSNIGSLFLNSGSLYISQTKFSRRLNNPHIIIENNCIVSIYQCFFDDTKPNSINGDVSEIDSDTHFQSYQECNLACIEIPKNPNNRVRAKHLMIAVFITLLSGMIIIGIMVSCVNKRPNFDYIMWIHPLP